MDDSTLGTSTPAPGSPEPGRGRETPSDASGKAAEPPRPPSLRLVTRVFLGPNGIRAGWRLAIFVALLVLIGFLLVSLAGPGVRRFKTPGVLTGDSIGFLSALLAALLMVRIEKRSLADYGLPGRGAFGARFWTGVVWGFLALTALLILIHLGHGFDFGGLALRGGKQIARYAGLWALTFLMVGFFEEFLFRGYALFTLSTGMGFWPSAILLSALFGGVHLHNAGEDWAGGLAAGLIGLFFCLTLRRTGSLWFAIGLHASWDYAESFLYSVPDSGEMIPGHLLSSSFHGPVWLTGGSVGPEGSALVFVIIAAMFVVFDRLYRQARFPLQKSRVSSRELGPVTANF
jgi:uncharacterized protein